MALGLKRKIDLRELRAAAVDGTITDLVAWRDVEAGEAVFVPAGTIHAIGAGLVIAEIQQRSDTTYRLFDHGRQRELHIEDALAVADRRPAATSGAAGRVGPYTHLAGARARISCWRGCRCRGKSDWWLNLGCETWLLVIGGSMRRSATIEAGHGRSDLSRRGSRQARGRIERVEGLARLCAAGPHRRPARKAGSCLRAARPRQPVRPYRRPQARPSGSTEAHCHDPAQPPGVHRQFAAAPLRHRDLHHRSAAGGRRIATRARNLHRGDDRSRPCLRLSARRRASDRRRRARGLCRARPSS